MRPDSRFEATDRLMSSWVLTTTRNGVLFVMTPDRLTSDRIARADVYRWPDEAEYAAKEANADPMWSRFGFTWEPMSYPEADNKIAGD